MNKRLSILLKLFDKIKKNKFINSNILHSYSPDKGYLSNTDKDLNNFILDQVNKKFPNDIIISEESYNKNFNLTNKSNNNYVWVIDPICGTTNYVKNIPFYSISISVIKGKKIISGVYDILRKEIFYTNGNKSYLNNNLIKTSKIKKLNQAVVSINCNQSSSKKILLKKLINIFHPPITRRIKIFESANLELSYVACGRLDAYINPDDKIWDMLGASKIVSNAEGKFTFFNDISSNIFNAKGIIASNKHIHEEIVKRINEKF